MCKYEDLIVITNRKLCKNDYYKQLDKIACLNPDSLILRETDLSEIEYEEVSKKVLQICKDNSLDLYIHSHIKIAKKYNIPNIHLSIPALRASLKDLSDFSGISVSCHSMEDVMEAEDAGATRIVLGNIYETDCKKGLPGKGLDFLREICNSTNLPVYAIGGINPDNLEEVKKSGAKGGCMMSGFMSL